LEDKNTILFVIDEMGIGKAELSLHFIFKELNPYENMAIVILGVQQF